MHKISRYWKCQLLGWAIYVLISYIFNNIIYHDFAGFFYKALFIFFFGLIFSHLIKITIKKIGILKQKFFFQIIYLTILTIVFSIIGTYVWMIALIKTGVWDIDELKKSQPDVFFYEVYFYNLFPVLLTIAGWVLIYFLVHYVRGVRKEEQLKIQYKLQMIELEAKALRAQMNPHFIFNCMNSIKALIQQKDEDCAVNYLTTFSKLLRTIFQNSDKREITLFDEIETCRLYTQLESMRFGKKFFYHFNIEEEIDLKSVQVPALIIQPFIENAIWHGIMPKEGGGKLNVIVEKKNDGIRCLIDDDGIGREMSKKNKFRGEPSSHQSKGVHLTQSRLDLDNTLTQRNASLEIIDKKDTDGKSAGTKIVLTFIGY